MRDTTSIIQHMLDSAKSKGANAVEVLPAAIASCFGLWVLRRTGHDHTNTLDASQERFPEPKTFQHRVLQQTLDDESMKAFRDLFKEKIFEQIFDCFYRLSADYTLTDTELVCVQESLIQTLLEMYYKQEYTPAWLHQLAVLVLQPLEGSFYDGVAGAGDSITAAYRFSTKHNGNLRFYAAEINETLRNIFVLRAHMNEIHVDFLVNDPQAASTPFQLAEQVDWSVMFPPFGDSRMLKALSVPSVVRELIGDVPISRDWLFPLLQIASLSPAGKGVCRVFSGMLFNSKYEPLRKRLLEMNVLDAVISLPANSLPFTAVPISLLIFNRCRKENAAVKMLDATSWITGKFELSGNRKVALSDDALNDLTCAFHQGTEVQLILPEKLWADNLLPQQYTVAKSEKVEDANLGSLHILNTSPPDWITLEDAAQIYHGINPATKSYGNVVQAGIIKLSNVQEGKLLPGTIEQYPVVDNGRLSRYHVQTDDILVSCKGSAIKMCMIPPDANNQLLLLSQHFLGIRVDKTRFDANFIYYFLKSPVGQRAIANCQIGSSIIMIRAQDIEKIHLPYIPLTEQQVYVARLCAQEDSIDRKISELRKELQSAQWDFYMQIGLDQVLTKEEQHERH